MTTYFCSVIGMAESICLVWSKHNFTVATPVGIHKDQYHNNPLQAGGIFATAKHSEKLGIVLNEP
jgi:hypothetical protein